MSRNGSGVFSLPVGYEATTGATATAAQHNDPLEDLQADANAARPIVAGGTGATSAPDARANLGVTEILGGSTAINPDLGTSTKYNGTNLVGRPLTNGQTGTLGKGFDVTDYDAGTKTTGTFTPAPASGNQQFYINGGAHTLAPPATSCTMALNITNNASAGVITVSGFDTIKGAFTTTDGDDFFANIQVLNGKSMLVISAL